LKDSSNRGVRSASLSMAIVVGAVGVLGALGGLGGCAEEVPSTRGPFLSWTRAPTTTMTITWERLVSQPHRVQWGTNPGALSETAHVSAPTRCRDDRYFHYTVTLEGLTPGTRYYYRIPGVQDEPAVFGTAPDDRDAKFTFIVYGDSREKATGATNQHNQIIAQINQRYPAGEVAFVLNTGDLVREHTSVRGWDLHFHAIGDLARHSPYLVASGNHDWNTDSADESSQPTNLMHELPAVDHPTEGIGGLRETSYAIGYGAAYLIVLGLPHTGHIGDTEVNRWLTEQLTIGTDHYRFVFVAFHMPPFDRRNQGYQDTTDVLAHQAQLLHSFGVDAVFNGHNHVLAHQVIRWDPTACDPDVRPVSYFISGGGGADLREAAEGSWSDTYGFGFYGQTLNAQSMNHYYAVEVDGAAGTATFTPMGLEGEALFPPYVIHAAR
jgi:Purple acid Phosphatase, N-terminal domain/Calcineurin-like phosphoesterase